MTLIPLKTTSLLDIRSTSKGMSLTVEGSDSPINIPSDSKSSEALSLFYREAMKELKEYNQKLGAAMSHVEMDHMALKASRGEPVSIPVSLTAPPEPAGKFRSWLSRMLTFGKGNKEPIPEEIISEAPVLEDTTVAPSPFGPVGRDNPLSPGSLDGNPSAGSETPSPKRTISPENIAPAPSPDGPEETDALPAATESLSGANPEDEFVIKEAYADQDGVHIEWSSGVKMSFAPEHKMAALLMNAYVEMEKENIPVVNVESVANRWKAREIDKSPPLQTEADSPSHSKDASDPEPNDAPSPSEASPLPETEEGNAGVDAAAPPLEDGAPLPEEPGETVDDSGTSTASTEEIPTPGTESEPEPSTEDAKPPRKTPAEKIDPNLVSPDTPAPAPAKAISPEIDAEPSV